jgi:hypothetical protein
MADSAELVKQEDHRESNDEDTKDDCFFENALPESEITLNGRHKQNAANGR